MVNCELRMCRFWPVKVSLSRLIQIKLKILFVYKFNLGFVELRKKSIPFDFQRPSRPQSTFWGRLPGLDIYLRRSEVTKEVMFLDLSNFVSHITKKITNVFWWNFVERWTRPNKEVVRFCWVFRVLLFLRLADNTCVKSFARRQHHCWRRFEISGSFQFIVWFHCSRQGRRSRGASGPPPALAARGQRGGRRMPFCDVG